MFTALARCHSGVTNADEVLLKKFVEAICTVSRHPQPHALPGGFAKVSFGIKNCKKENGGLVNVKKKYCLSRKYLTEWYYI